jgi:hypothetical protein
MSSLKPLFVYLFWPNPGNAYYVSPKIQVLLVVCVLLILLSFAVRLWRRNMPNPVMKRLSRSWPTAAFWFGVSGLVFLISRVEGVGFLAMRFWWVAWGAIIALYLGVQIRMFKMRYYEPLPREKGDDTLARYLPKKKR